MKTVSRISSRERVRVTLNHQEADRVPFDFGSGNSCPQIGHYIKLKKMLGVHSPPQAFYRDTHILPHEDMLQRFKIDIRYLHVGVPYKTPPKWTADNCFIDEWGGTWEKPDGSLYWDPKPIYPQAQAGIDGLETYPWPDPDDPGRYAGFG